MGKTTSWWTESSVAHRTRYRFGWTSAGSFGVWVRRRTKGSHHIFRRPGVEERLNLQESGAKAKPYQVRQVRAVLLKYHLIEGK